MNEATEAKISAGLAFIFGIAAGAVMIMFIDIITFEEPLNRAKSKYARCLEDGGTVEHCMKRYFLGVAKP